MLLKAARSLLQATQVEAETFFAKTLPWTVLQRVCTEFPELVAFKFFDEQGICCKQYTFQDLEEQTELLAKKLTGWGVLPGYRVMLLYPPSCEFFIAFWACLRLGAIAVPVAPPLPNSLKADLQRLRTMMDDCKPSIVLTNPKYRMFVASTNGRGHEWPTGKMLKLYPGVLSGVKKGAVGCCNTARSIATHVIKGSDVAYLQYTSGSTSEPKGVMITHANLLDNITKTAVCKPSILNSDVQYLTGKPYLSWVPQYHDMGLVGVLWGLLTGTTVVLVHTLLMLKDPLRMLQIMSHTQTAYTSSNIAALEIMAKKWCATPPDQRPALDLSRLEVILLGAEPVMPSSIQRFMSAFGHTGISQAALMPSYGLAEHVVFVCNVGDVLLCKKTGLVSHGHPPPDVDLKIVDPETACPVAPGETGEIWVCSASKAIGYYGAEKQDMNNEVFRAQLHPDFCRGLRYLRTGDQGYVTHQGLFICGRITDMLIIGGRNVFPQDIEEDIADSFPATRRGRIAAYRMKGDIRDDECSEGVGIAAEIRPPFPDGKACHALCDQIMSHVQQRFEIPVSVVSLVPPRSLPTTTSGKIQRSRCKQMKQEGRLQVLEGGELSRHQQINNNDWMQGMPQVLAAHRVSAVFKEHGIWLPDVPISQQGISSVDLIPLQHQLQLISGTQINFEDMSSLTAREVHALCCHSLAICTTWRVTCRALQLTHGKLVVHLPASAQPGPQTNQKSALHQPHDVPDLVCGTDGLVGPLCEDKSAIDAMGPTSDKISVEALSTIRCQRLASERWRAIAIKALNTVAEEHRALTRSVKDVVSKISKSRNILELDRPSQRDTPQGKALPFAVYAPLQLLGSFLVLLMSAAAMIPAYYYVANGLFSSSLGKPWLYTVSVGGQPLRTTGLLLPFVFVVWQLTLTLEVVVIKWLLIGQYKEGTWSLWSWYFLKWWLMERVMDLWQWWVGVYVQHTFLMNIFYNLVGCRVAWSADLPASLRGFDLVTIGSGTTINGKVAPFVVSPGRLWSGRITIGSNCTSGRSSIVQGGVEIGNNSTVEQGAVLTEGMEFASETILSGNPAMAAAKGKEDVVAPQDVFSTVSLLIIKSLLLCPVLVWLLSLSTIPYSLLWTSSGQFPRFLFAPLLYWLLLWLWLWAMAAVMCVTCKWMLLPTLKPGAVFSNSLWFKLRRWLVDAVGGWAAMHTGSYFGHTLACNVWAWLLGMKLNMLNSVVKHDITPSSAACVEMESAAYDSTSIGYSTALDTAGNKTTFMRTVIKKGAVVGFYSLLAPGVTIGRGSAVGFLSVVTADVADGKYVSGYQGQHMITGDTSGGDVSVPWWWGALRCCHLVWAVGLRATMVAAGAIPAYYLIIILFFDGNMWFWYDGYSYTLPRPVAFLLMPGVFLLFGLGQFVWCFVFAHIVRLVVRGRTDMDALSPLALLYADFIHNLWLGRIMWFFVVRGSPVAVAYSRALGAHVAWDAYIASDLHDHYLLQIGSGSVLDEESFVMGHSVQDGKIVLCKTCVGVNCEVQQSAAVTTGDYLPDDCSLGPRAKLFRGMEVPPGSTLYGVPARQARVRCPGV